MAKEVVTSESHELGDSTLAQLAADADALEAFINETVPAENASATLFPNVEKDALVGVPFTILEWNFRHSENYDAPFVEIKGVTRKGEKFTVTDFGGLYEALQAVTADRTANGLDPNHALRAPSGLTVSSYDAHVSKRTGDKVPAGTTHYFA